MAYVSLPEATEIDPQSLNAIHQLIDTMLSELYTTEAIVGLSDSDPLANGTASPGADEEASRADHVHPVQTAVTGNAGTATALATARTIGGVPFDGTANIDLPGVNLTGNQDTSGNAATATNATTAGECTGNASTATTLETARNIGGVEFDGSADIDLPGVNTSGNQDTSGNAATSTTASSCTGNAATATTLQTPRTIGGVSFNGSANINLPGVNTTGNQDTSGNAATSTACTGNAATATKLATARTIGGVGFDGTANINLPGVNATGNQNTTGNAATATKLSTARTLSLTGDASGSASFDGSANASINVSVADDSHNHVISNVDGLQSALDSKAGISVATSESNGLMSSANVTKLTSIESGATGDQTASEILSLIEGITTGLVSVSKVGTIAELTAITGAETGDVCIVGDKKRGGLFEYSSTLSSTNDNGLVFNGWVRRYEGMVHVNWFDDGTSADNVAFSCAAQAAPAQMLQLNGSAANGIPYPDHCDVYVDAGTWILTSIIDTDGKEVTWHFDKGAIVNGYGNYLRGTVSREGMRVNTDHHGILDNACSYSITGNTGLEKSPGILGIGYPYQLSGYLNRDSCGLFIQNDSPPALIDTELEGQAAATYTSNRVYFGTAFDADTEKKLRKGMIIDTKHSISCSGFVESWDESGSWIQVTAWYEYGDETEITPSGSAHCYVNGYTKVWAQNSQCRLYGGNPASRSCGYELDMINTRGDASTNIDNRENRVWGFDSVMKPLTGYDNYKGQAGYISRDDWIYGYVAYKNDVGYCFWGDTGDAFVAKDASGNTHYRVKADGTVEAGLPGTYGSIYYDFHTSANNNDYDSRIIATGGSSSSGEGLFEFISATTKFYGVLDLVQGAYLRDEKKLVWYNGNLVESTRAFGNSPLEADGFYYIQVLDESYGDFRNYLVGPDAFIQSSDGHANLGTASYRFNTVYASTGSINTSDERLKTFVDIEDSEIACAKEMITHGIIRKFKFNDAVKEKGDDARLHFGVGAQTVISFFEKHGLDAFEYGIVCHDELEDIKGEEIEREFPDRYAVRYEELYGFLILGLCNLIK